MNTKANAILQWAKKENGGRTLPPVGPCHFSVVWFPGFGKKWEEDMWSFRIKFITWPDDTLTHLVKVSFLADEAPDYLHPNQIFELYEGRKLVAKGKVIEE